MRNGGLTDKLDREIEMLDNIKYSRNVLESENFYGINLSSVYSIKDNIRDKVENKQIMRDSGVDTNLQDDDLSFVGMAKRGLSWNIVYMDNLLRKETCLINALNWTSTRALSNGIDLNIPKEEENKNKENNISEAIEVKNVIEMYHKKPLIDFTWLGKAHGGAGLLFIIDNNTNEKELLTPLTEDKIKKGTSISLRPLTRLYQIMPDYSMPDTYITKIGKEEGIYDSSELGKPKYYRITISGDMLKKGSELGGKYEFSSIGVKSFLVHRSRLGIYNGSQLSWIEKQVEGFFGLSLIELSIDSLKMYKKSLAEIMRLLQRSNVPVYKIQGLGSTGRIGSMGITNIENAIVGITYSQETGETVAIGEKEDFSYAQVNFNGLNEILLDRKKEVSSDAKAPLSVTFNEKDDNEEKEYYFDIQNIQERQLKPVMQQLIPLIYKSLYGRNINSKYNFTFRTLEQVTEKEKADKLKIAVEIIVSLFKDNLIDVQSAHDMLMSASDNINDMLYELNDKLYNEFDGKKYMYKDFQIELANALNNQRLATELKSNGVNGGNQYNMAETKLKGQISGGNQETTKKPTARLDL